VADVLKELIRSMRNTEERRHIRTVKFVQKHIHDGPILDLGGINRLACMIGIAGYDVFNTNTDLDINYKIVKSYDIITAFEIFEHMFAPFNLLNDASGRLVASVPLRLWFAKAYWPDDKLDRHYHEFEKKQFNALLERTGWTIKASEMWTAWDYKIGIRPILRLFYKRHYIVYAEK
jgi:hypothetical protein